MCALIFNFLSYYTLKSKENIGVPSDQLIIFLVDNKIIC